jgi:hypothetical protein
LELLTGVVPVEGLIRVGLRGDQVWGGGLLGSTGAAIGRAAGIRTLDVLSGMDGMGIAGNAIRAGRAATRAGSAQADGVAATPQSSRSLFRAVATAGP